MLGPIWTLVHLCLIPCFMDGETEVWGCKETYPLGFSSRLVWIQSLSLNHCVIPSRTRTWLSLTAENLCKLFPPGWSSSRKLERHYDSPILWMRKLRHREGRKCLFLRWITDGTWICSLDCPCQHAASFEEECFRALNSDMLLVPGLPGRC